MTTILFLLFILLLIHYSVFLIKIMTGLNKLKKNLNERLPDEFISVIIPFRNESENILSSLKSIEDLYYPQEKFEVIYVDDNSTDDSFPLLIANRKKTNIRILKLPDEIFSKGNKKRAVQYGIENSKGDIIVQTDADCVHASKWLQCITKNFDADTAFVSGPVDFHKDSSLFSKMQKIEFEGLILAGAGLIVYGEPIICNGANAAYRKKVFEEVSGFDGNNDLSSGDDVFLLQKISQRRKYKIKFSCDSEAVVLTNSCKNLKEFIRQRRRWAGKVIYFADKFLVTHLIFILIFYTGLIIQPVLALSGVVMLWWSFITSVFIKILVEFQIIRKGEKLFYDNNNIIIFILTEILHIPYIMVSTLSGLSGNFSWKGRKIKR